MLTVEDLIQWRPDEFSEDHLTNFVKQFFKDELQWHVAYHNPPSGSWKEITLVHDGEEYLQEIHKKGVDKMKRPDLVAQYLGKDTDSDTLLLFESKQERSSWDPELPEMMRLFFEGIDDYEEAPGVLNVPFWHRRQRNEEIWEALNKDDPARQCFMRKDISYVYGFGYLSGIISPAKLTDQIEWMEEQLAEYDDVPPIVVMTVGWEPKTYEPLVAAVFSETFPTELREHLETVLPTVEGDENTSTLSDFEEN